MRGVVGGIRLDTGRRKRGVATDRRYVHTIRDHEAMYRAEIGHHNGRAYRPRRLHRLDRQVTCLIEPDIDWHAGVRRHHGEHVVTLAVLALRTTPCDRCAAMARRPEVIVTDVCLTDGAGATEYAPVDDHQSCLVEVPVFLAIPSAASAKRRRRKKRCLTHSTHLVPVIATTGKAGSHDAAFCMDDLDRAQGIDVESGSRLTYEFCDSWIAIGRCGLRCDRDQQRKARGNEQKPWFHGLPLLACNL